MKKNIIVVDDKDNIIDYKPRDVVDKEKLRYRVSALWIKNPRGEILLARRSYTKTHHPGKWGPAVSGTVEQGETYEDNIIKESYEELGLKNIKLILGPKLKYDTNYKHFTQWFFTTIDKPTEEFNIQKDEVAEIKWFSENEIKGQLKKNNQEFMLSLKEMLKF